MPDDQLTRNERFAASYDRILAGAEDSFLGTARSALLADLTGRVVDLGAGTGANLAHYGAATDLFLVEPSKPMRDQLRERVATLAASGGPRPAIIGATAEALPFPDGHADAVVCTLVLCSVGSLGAGLSEIARVLRPGGTLAFLEHCHAGGLRGWVQRAVSPLTQRYAGGCHCDRDILGAIGRTELKITDATPLALPYPYKLLVENPFVAGRAKKAA